MRVGALLLVGLVAIYALLGIGTVLEYQESGYGEIVDVGGLRLTVFRPAAMRTPAPCAILLHGFDSNRGSMNIIGAELARMGVLAIAPDLPGHGGSPGVLLVDLKNVTMLVDEVYGRIYPKLIDTAVRLGGDEDRMIVVGHSLGGALALKIAHEIDVKGLVLLSPLPLNLSVDTNTAIIAAKFDEVIPKSAEKSFAENLFGGAFQPNTIYGSFADGSARAFFTVYSDHIALPYAPKAIALVREWASKALNVEAGGGWSYLRPEAYSVAMLLSGLVILAYIPKIVGGEEREASDTSLGASVFHLILTPFLAFLLAIPLLALLKVTPSLLNCIYLPFALSSALAGAMAAKLHNTKIRVRIDAGSLAVALAMLAGFLGVSSTALFSFVNLMPDSRRLVIWAVYGGIFAILSIPDGAVTLSPATWGRALWLVFSTIAKFLPLLFVDAVLGLGLGIGVLMFVLLCPTDLLINLLAYRHLKVFGDPLGFGIFRGFSIAYFLSMLSVFIQIL